LSEQSYSLEQDLKEAQAMVDTLDTYVRGSELYGRVGGGGFFSGGRMPSLTVGALLMRLRRLNVFKNGMSPSQQHLLEEIESRHQAVAREWQMHYNEKMVREAHSRLDAMSRFFDECNDNPRACAGNYGPEALRRTIAQEIARATEGTVVDTDGLDKKLRRVDSKLRQFAQPAEFLWDPALQPAYPRETYWWLWSKPQLPDKK
jgi:hypothetical protein